MNRLGMNRTCVSKEVICYCLNGDHLGQVNPMKIMLTTWGTIGDIRPFLALAKSLKNSGHQVQVCASSVYGQQFEEIGVGFRPVGVPFDRDRFDQIMDGIINIRNPLKSALVIAKEGILNQAEQWYNDCLEAMTDCDIAVCHSADMPGQEAAVKKNLPWMTVSYCPGFIKSSYTAPSPAPNLGKYGNYLLWKIVELMMRYQVDPLFNAFFDSIGGNKRNSIGIKGMYSPRLNLVASSSYIAQPPPDLPSYHRFTGAWFLGEPDYEVPLDLQEFLDQGPLPIIVSFGSMGGTKGLETTQTIVDAVQVTGQRAIIQAGWGKLGSKSRGRDGNILSVGHVPHDFLFRQGICVIHHGGAGTTHAACLAGVPSIVIPHLADQPYWGNKLQKLGVAPKILYRKRMTTKSLASRIFQVINSESMAINAKELGKKIETEDGLGKAVELVEAFGCDFQNN